MNREQRRKLEKLMKKPDFEMKGKIGLNLTSYKIVDKDGRDVTKERLTLSKVEGGANVLLN